jgi:alkylmercury lyase
MTTPPLDDLVEDLARLDVSRDPREQRAILALLGMLAGGRPVTARSLAERTGWDVDAAADLLDRLPRLERDHLERIVGCFGLTLRTTPHAFAIGHHLLHTWCAWDALYLPVVLDAAAEVTSICPVTEREVTLLVTPDGVERCSPPTVLVSFVPLERTAPDRVRGEFCSLVHFLADEAAADAWTERVPESFVLTVDDAFELGRRAVRRSYGEALTDG